MTPDQKGSVAEAEIAAAAVRLGVGVLKPLNDGLRYDLVFDLRPKLLRVQCKWAARFGDVVVVRCRTFRRTRNGYSAGNYSAHDVDAIGAYCPEVDRCFLVPLERVDGRDAIWLRLTSTRNNQRKGVNWAEDFDFAA